MNKIADINGFKKNHWHGFALVLLLTLGACQTPSSHVPTTASEQSSEPIDQTSPVGLSYQNLICDNPIRWQGQVIGDGHCVSLIKQCASAPLTSWWRPGKQVKGNRLLPGTIIATFVGQQFQSISGHHAAIYIDQNSEGIWVWDQWQGVPVHRRLIRWRNPGARESNLGTAYRVVEVPVGNRFQAN